MIKVYLFYNILLLTICNIGYVHLSYVKSYVKLSLSMREFKVQLPIKQPLIYIILHVFSSSPPR